MLERAWSHALGWPLDSLDAYVARPEFRLLKLHGSVNWVRIAQNDIGNANPERALIGLGADIHLSTAHFILPVGSDRLDGRPIFPAIAIPVETKSDFECPAKHLETLKADLPSVTRVLLIGWRATEIHFLKLWAAHHAQEVRIRIVAGSASGATQAQERLEGAGIFEKSGVRISGAGFGEFVTGAELDNFLRD